MMHPSPFAVLPCDGQIHLRILATTDLHAQLLPFDYFRNRPMPTVGLARAAGLVQVLRERAANVLLFDNGDFLQGSPVGDFLALDRGLAGGGTHPVIAAMNALGYDAATLGNHEFNYGLPFLAHALRGAAFPVVSANLAPLTGTGLPVDRLAVPPYVILDRMMTDGAGQSVPLRVGVIGLLPPQTGLWDRDNLHGRAEVHDMVATAAARVPEMRAAGADLVVALAHTGIGAFDHADGMENAALPLARIAGIDALVTGHSHLVFPSPQFAGMTGVDARAGLLAGKPAVMAGCFGSHVGVIDLLLDRAAGRWRVAASAVQAQPIARPRAGGRLAPQTRSLAAVLEAADTTHAATRAHMARQVGRSAARLSSAFALVADTPAFRIVCTALAAFVTDRLRGTVHEGVPVLGATAPFRAGGRAGPRAYLDIAPGPLVLRHMAELYPFPNAVRAVLVTGAGLRAWLERAALIYRPVVAGRQDAPLIDPDVPSYTFDLIAGLTFAIEPSGPPGARVRDLAFSGKAVTNHAAFIVATNSYRAAMLGQAAPIALAAPDLVRDVVARWVAGHGPVTADMAPGWRLILPPDTAVTFDTSPRALRSAHDLHGLTAADLGLTPDGFRRLRLTAR